MLRFRVCESLSSDAFRATGERASRNLSECLLPAGRSLETFDSILDFGCGCGRTLVWLARQLPGKRFYGTDVDPEAIHWCRESLKFGDFCVNGALPPLDYPDETFDLVFGISVFTHMDEDRQRRWLPELRRVLRSGGILILSVHGKNAWKVLSRDAVADLQRTGTLFVESRKLKGFLPEWYQTSYHTRDYVLGMIGAHLRLLEYIEGGMGDQDVIVAQK